jgi:4-hydroxy-tetrahydrodipicolinate synthase
MGKLEGIYAAMVTPLNRKLKVDGNGLKYEVDFLIANRVHGLVILGSVGEFPYITVEEKKRIIDIVVEQTKGRVPVIVCTSSMGTDEVILLSKYAKDSGADGLMVTLPVYYPLSDEDIFNHYYTISKAVNLPILLYDFPSLTHLDMSPELISRLSSIENVVGIKVTAAAEKAEEILKTVKKQSFSVFTGTSFLLLRVLQMGGVGVIDPIPCIAPRDVISIYESFKIGNMEKAAQLQQKLYKLMPVLAVSVQPPLVKEAMHQLGHPIQPYVKRPLPQITREQKEMVRKSLLDIGLLQSSV